MEGVPYHVTQRGNGRQQVFFEDRDYSLYLDLLRENCQTKRLAIWAYCLMPNHVHLIAQLGDEDFLETLERRCGRRLRAQPVGRPNKLDEDESDQLSLGYGV